MEEVRPERLEEARRVHGDRRAEEVLLRRVADDGEHRDSAMFDFRLVHALAPRALDGVHTQGVELQVSRLQRLGAVLEAQLEAVEFDGRSKPERGAPEGRADAVEAAV